MYDEDLNISLKTVIKWIISLAIAAIILIPIVFIFYLNLNTPVFSYNYTNTKNLMQEITNDVEFNSSTKGITIKLTSDMINSYVDDEIEDKDLGLPKKIEMMDVHIDTGLGRAFFNLKAYGIKAPVSAAITLKQTESQASVSLSNFKLAELPLDQKTIDKLINGQKLSYSIKMKDLNVIPYFQIKSINWKSNGIHLFYEIDYKEVYNRLRRRPERMAGELATLIEKNQALAPMLDLVIYLSNSDELTLNEIKYYLDMLLENQAVADALIDMVKSGNL